MLARVAQAHAMSMGRDHVSPVDVQAVAADVLSHRLEVSGEAVARSYVAEILEKIQVPG